MKKAKDKLKSKLTRKFRLVVLNEASFEERFTFKLTPLNVFVFGGIFSILLVAITSIIIAFTPIKEYIPGYSSTKLKKQATQLFYKVDSLEAKMAILAEVTKAMKPILIGEDTLITIELPYKNIPLEGEDKLKFPVRNDSLKAFVTDIKRELDSLYKSYYLKESNILQQKHQAVELSLQELHEKNIKQLNEAYENQLELQRDSLGDFRLKLVKAQTEIISLKKNHAYADLNSKYDLSKLPLQTTSGGNNAAAIRQFLDRQYASIDTEKSIEYTQKISAYRDSLQAKDSVIAEMNTYLSNYQSSYDGEVLEKSNPAFGGSAKDSIYREQIARLDRFNLYDFEYNDTESIIFVAPLNGMITEKYNPAKKHYAVDVAAINGADVKAVADGTVVFAEWTVETGNVIIIEHLNKYLSVYKHNKLLYRKQGDVVLAGEVISKAGSSGEYSTGPHLHFEMWHNGNAVNPLNFIEFE